MEYFSTWIVDNKEWLFSGIGVVVIAWIGRIIYRKRQAHSSQNIRSGDKSTSIQAGRDVQINIESKRNGAEEGE